MGKYARLEARISPDVLALLKRAAEIEGRSLTDFVVAAARQAAEKTIVQARRRWRPPWSGRLPVTSAARARIESLFRPKARPW